MKINELINIFNENMENYYYTEEDWVIASAKSLIENEIIASIDIYGRDEADSLKEDMSTNGSEIIIDHDNKHISIRHSKISLYAESHDQFIDFEVDNIATLKYADREIPIIDDVKEDENVSFNEDLPLIILREEYEYTTDRGLVTNKTLIIYIPNTLPEITDEEADY